MFPVCIVSETPPWDALPVAKIVTFPPDTPINDRIYAQAQLCFLPEDGLHVRLWSFEVPPLLENRFLRFALQGKSSSIHKISISPLPQKGIIPLVGEDLQGIFWGGEFCLEPQTLSSFLDEENSFSKGFVFHGNFFNQARSQAQFFSKELDKFEFVQF